MLVILLGPSCSGKSTFQKELVENEGYHAVRTATTRPRRMGEDASAYYFLKDQAFAEWEAREISSASRLSEAGATGYHVTRLPGRGTALIELSSSHPEVSWNSYHDTQKSSLPMRCPSYTSGWMGLRGNLALAVEEIHDENTSDEWPQIPSISGTTLGRMVFGSLRRIISWIASTIRRTTN